MTKKIFEEYHKGPVQFVMNASQTLLVGVMFLAFVFNMGGVKAEFTMMKNTIAELQTTVKNSFEANAAEHSKIKCEISAMTGKPIN
jgi:hypothetical protein